MVGLYNSLKLCLALLKSLFNDYRYLFISISFLQYRRNNFLPIRRSFVNSASKIVLLCYTISLYTNIRVFTKPAQVVASVNEVPRYRLRTLTDYIGQVGDNLI